MAQRRSRHKRLEPLSGVGGGTLNGFFRGSGGGANFHKFSMFCLARAPLCNEKSFILGPRSEFFTHFKGVKGIFVD